MERLTGQALLDKIASMAGTTKAELVIACGYVTTPRTMDAEPRPQYAAFNEAVLEAQGFKLPVAPSRPGRELSYKVRRQATGSIVLGDAYLSQLPITEKQAFDVELDYETGTVTLAPASTSVG